MANRATSALVLLLGLILVAWVRADTNSTVPGNGTITDNVICRTFSNSYDGILLPHPTPSVETSFEKETSQLTINVVAAYSPQAAFVVDFVPFKPGRVSLSEYGVCENRDETAFPSEGWDWNSIVKSCPTADDLSNSPNPLYPQTGGCGIWTRNVIDCATIEYSLTTTLSDLSVVCDSEILRRTTLNNLTAVSVSLYATYALELENKSGFSISEHEYEITIDETLEISTHEVIRVPECVEIDKTGSGFSWSQNKMVLGYKTKVPYPQEGLPCNFTATTDCDIAPIVNNQACDCDLHCSRFFCSSSNGVCEQDWSVALPNEYKPGAAAGNFTLRWDFQSCSSYAENGTCVEWSLNEPAMEVKLVVESEVEAYNTLESGYVPVAVATVEQPPGCLFNGTLTNETMLVVIDIYDLTGPDHGVKSIRLCGSEFSIDNFACPDGGFVIFEDLGGNSNSTDEIVNVYDFVGCENITVIEQQELVQVKLLISDPRNWTQLFVVESEIADCPGILPLFLNTSDCTGRWGIPLGDFDGTECTIIEPEDPDDPDNPDIPDDPNPPDNPDPPDNPHDPNPPDNPDDPNKPWEEPTIPNEDSIDIRYISTAFVLALVCAIFTIFI